MRGVTAALAILAAGCLAAQEQPPLNSARALLGPETTSILVEIDHVGERTPSPSAIDAMVEALRQTTGKPVRVVGPAAIREDLHAPDGSTVWTDRARAELEHATRDEAPSSAVAAGDAAYLHVLYLDGRPSGGAVGLNDGEVSYVFPDRLEFASVSPVGTNPNREDAERSVLVHETGHALGLVDNGVPMVRPHAHPDDPHHSRNPDSVMWPRVDQYDGLVALIDERGGAPYRFDADDLADISAFRASLGR